MKRTTADIYDEAYYTTKYKTWMEGGLTLKNPRIKVETEKKFDFIKKYMPDVKSILIPGCSFGMLVMLLRDKGYEAEGIDVSEYAIKYAPTRMKSHIKQMNVMNMEYSDDEFELVAPFDIVEHLYWEELLAAIKEVSRVASKFILIRTPVPYYTAESGVSDFSQHPSLHHAGHVSIYPWDFWARRVVRHGKFEFWFASLWGRKGEVSCEAWITFRRKDGETD